MAEPNFELMLNILRDLQAGQAQMREEIVAMRAEISRQGDRIDGTLRRYFTAFTDINARLDGIGARLAQLEKQPT
jgi:hypothetical protein